MKVPDGFSEAEVIQVIQAVADALAPNPKYAISGFDQDDLRSEIFVASLELLNRQVFDPSRGTLAAFLYRNAANRLKNKKRDLCWRHDCPCPACHEGKFCNGESVCSTYSKWLERNTRKANLAAGLPLDKIDDEKELSLRRPSTVETEAETAEILRLIDERLPVELRSSWLKMRESIYLPRFKRQKVEEALLDILDDAGLPLPTFLNPQSEADQPTDAKEADEASPLCTESVEAAKVEEAGVASRWRDWPS